MSGVADSSTCTYCGGLMNTYVDWKPHDYVSGECLDCGFCFYTKDAQMSLEEVNDLRAEYDLEPLKKLKKTEYEMA